MADTRSCVNALLAAGCLGFAALFAAGCANEAPDPTVTSASRALEGLNWHFKSDSSVAGVRFVTYARALGDLALEAEMAQTRGEGLMLVGFSVRGPAESRRETDKLQGARACHAGAVACVPGTKATILEAWGAARPRGHPPETGLPRDEGVRTSPNGWRVTVMEFREAAPSRADNPLVTVMLSR